MNLETIISSAVISAIISGIFGITTATIAKKSAVKVAEEATRRELAMLNRTWEHDDNLIFEQAFKEMVDAVTRYLHDSSRTKQEEARTKTAYVRSLACGNLAASLDELYASLQYRPSRNAEERLKEVMICKQHEAIS